MFWLQAGQPELIALEKAMKETMIPAGTAREVIASVYIDCLWKVVLSIIC